MEWLYDTLDEDPLETPGTGRRFPFWTALFLLAGVAVVAFLVWLLIGQSPLSLNRPDADVTPTQVVLPLMGAASQPVSRTITSPLTTPTITPWPPAAFEIGDRVIITGTGNRGLRVRAGAGLDFLTQEIYTDGDAFFVMPNSDPDGAYPVEVNGYVWWRLRAADGLIGWTVEDFLKAAPLLPQMPTPTVAAP